MKKLVFIIPLILLLPAADSRAALIILRDGTRVEGTVEGEMDGMKLIKTRYGSLTIDGKDIFSIGPPEIMAKDIYNVGLATVPVPAPAVSTGAAVVPAADLPVSTGGVTASTMTVSAPAETLPALPELPPAPKAGPEYTFKTVTSSTASFERIYFENGAVIATETFNSGGELLALAGAIKDGSYREYYDLGNLKTEKTVVNARTEGTLKAYYPAGVLQSEAHYLQGKLSGPVRIYNENAKLLFEQNFKDGTPNGWFREFDEGGAVKSELFYTDGRPAEKPKPEEERKPAQAAAAASGENLLSARSQSLARGERISFYVNDKYVGKLHLDKDYNIISKEGRVPDGEVQVSGKKGTLEKGFRFLKNEVVLLTIFNAAGGVEAEYTFKEGKAVKK